jgi:hypothetical protein
MSGIRWTQFEISISRADSPGHGIIIALTFNLQKQNKTKQNKTKNKKQKKKIGLLNLYESSYSRTN